MSATVRLLTARPLLVAYALVLGMLAGVLVDRQPPPGPALTAATAGGPSFDPERERPGPPLWLQLFRPSPATAQRLLRQGIPLLALLPEPPSGREEGRLVLYAPGAGAVDDGLLPSLLPFLRTPAPARPPAAAPLVPLGVPQHTPEVQPPPPAAAPAPQPQPPLPQPQPPAPARAGPLVGIYHTHDYESYVSEFPGRSFTQQELWLVISNNPEKSVVRVGRHLAEALRDRGIGVVHSPANHQKDGYWGAYEQSLRTARALLALYPSVRVLIDIHRDSAPRSESTATIKGEKVARVGLVVGMGDRDLPHPGWQKNLAWAKELHVAMEQKHPGLSRGIIQRPDRYNQHLSPGAVLLEIGSAENSLQEALRAADLLADVLAELHKKGKFPG